MHEELDARGGAATELGPEVPLDERDRDRCELIDGVWVPKHPDSPPPDDDRPGCELLDGLWVEKGMSNVAAVVEGNVILAVKLHVGANRLGTVFTESAQYQLFADQPRQIRKPDVSFVAGGRFANNQLPPGRMQLAPDLAVEVVSPNDTAEEVERKLDEYLRAGTRLVWLVYVPTRNVWAYKPDGTAKVYRAGDALPGDDVLPGFSAPVAELFEGV